MSAEKTRTIVNMWYGNQVYKVIAFKTKQEACVIEDEAIKELDELERLAEIGIATEKLIKEKQVMYDVEFDRDNFSCEEIKTVGDLLEWHNKQK